MSRRNCLERRKIDQPAFNTAAIGETVVAPFGFVDSGPHEPVWQSVSLGLRAHQGPFLHRNLRPAGWKKAGNYSRSTRTGSRLDEIQSSSGKRHGESH